MLGHGGMLTVSPALTIAFSAAEGGLVSPSRRVEDSSKIVAGAGGPTSGRMLHSQWRHTGPLVSWPESRSVSIFPRARCGSARIRIGPRDRTSRRSRSSAARVPGWEGWSVSFIEDLRELAQRRSGASGLPRTVAARPGDNPMPRARTPAVEGRGYKTNHSDYPSNPLPGPLRHQRASGQR